MTSVESLLELPIPKIKTRPINQQVRNLALAQGMHPTVANIVAGRAVSIEHLANIISPKMSLLEHPNNMQDMLKAANRLAMAIINKEYIGIETDHDCDGQTSHAVIYYNLIRHFNYPRNLIKSYIGNRLTEGYGLSASVANRILQDTPRVSLVITADNGSADEPRIATLKANNIDVIITDHHQIPSTNLPHSAYAWINPTRADCNYDPYIAGCMVAWLLMVATRIELIKRGYLSVDAPKLYDTLDYVAVGTVADCVSFARSLSNRAVVKFGLQLINTRQKYCWQALDDILPNNITAEDLGFKIGPLLNSDGRLATAFGSVSFLLAESMVQAKDWLRHLKLHNTERRNIQKNITLDGLTQATKQVAAGKSSICIFLPQGHVGVHGISASKIKDNFGRPTAFFAPKFGEQQLISGSLRGIENFHVREALQYIANNDPQLLIAFGGHKGAGGVTLQAANFNKFVEYFEQATKMQLGSTKLEPIIWTDGILDSHLINLAFMNDLKILEPFGREFESPVFHTKAKIEHIKFIGDGTHARLMLNINGIVFNAVWFNMRYTTTAPCKFNQQDEVMCAFSLLENNFNKQKSCELHVIGMNSR